MCLSTLGISALAGNSFTSYNVTVGRVNGSGYTSNQSKATSGANGRIVSTSVGADYTVDARMQKSDGTANGSWYRSLGDNQDTGYSVDGHADQKAGNSVRIQFSNDLLTLVNVQVTGQWMSQ